MISNDHNPLNRYTPTVPFLSFNRKEYAFSEQIESAIFSRLLDPIAIRNVVQHSGNMFALAAGDGGILDSVNEYHLNSLGYRSKEFSNNTEFIFAGCSYSFGEGAAEADVWGARVARQFGYSYSNLSCPGASVQWIVKNLFSYFKEYGNPKVLACLFPDFGRMTMPINKNINAFDGFHDDIEGSTMLHDLHLSRHSSLFDRPKYVKKPYPVEDTTPVELPMLLSIQYISMLSQYCDANGIQFVWGTWETSGSIYMAEIAYKYGYSEYVDLENQKWHDDSDNGFRQYYHIDSDLQYVIDKCNTGTCIETECHLELKDKNGKYFYVGSDIEHVGGRSAHFGVHRHAHVAEAFIESLSSNNNQTPTTPS